MNFESFYDIYWTNLLTSATVPIPVYYVCLLQKMSKIESARKNLEISQKFYFTRRLRKPEGGLPGGHGLTRHGPGAAPLVPTPGGCLVDSDSPSRCLFAYKITLGLKTEEHPSKFPETHLSTAANKNPNSGDKSLCFGTLPGRGSSPGAIFIDGAASMMLRE